MTTDFHHHFIPAWYAQTLQREGVAGAEWPDWSAAGSVEMMGRRGVDRALLSLPPPGPWLGDRQQAQRLARECNDFAAGLVRDDPGHFGALACLPTPDVAGAIGEIRYALDERGFDGVLLLSNVDGVYVGDPELDPVLSELDRRAALVLLHPNDVPAQDEQAPLYPVPERPTDLVRAYARLLLHDAFLRFSRIRWILADSGGPLPYLADRLARAHYTDGEKLRWGRIARDLLLGRNGGLALAQHVDYDSVAADDPVVRAALERLVPPERIRFGSNYPFDVQ